MESQKIIMMAIGILLFIQLPAQRIWEDRKGSVTAQGNLAPGYLFAQKSVSAYVDGDIQLFVEDRCALTGSIWASFATTQKNKPGLRANHAVYWGAEYHFLKPSRWDPFVGIAPGLGLVRASYMNGDDELKLTPFSVAPLIAASVGCNYYIGSVFHFFVKMQGVAGVMFSTEPSPQRLDELKFMAGLGWNLRLWKVKKHDSWGKKV